MLIPLDKPGKCVPAYLIRQRLGWRDIREVRTGAFEGAWHAYVKGKI